MHQAAKPRLRAWWIGAVHSAFTFSDLALLLRMADACIRWTGQ